MKKLFLVFIAAFLTACGSHSNYRQYQSPSALPLQRNVASEKRTIDSAKTQADKLLKLGAAPNSPDLERLQLTLALAQTDAAHTQQTLDDLTKADQDAMAKANEEIKNQSAQKDKAIADKKAMEPKRKRDLTALFVAWVLCSICCLLGPLLCKAYPPLLLIPTTFEGAACAIVGGILFSGVTGLLLLFGIL